MAEWVHHHLAFGFGPIEVHVNRSEDGSVQVLERIAAMDPRVRVIQADHFDQRAIRPRDIQRSIYREAHRRLRRELPREAYALFLDVDEFWVPCDLQSSIQEVLLQAGRPQIASFNWFVRHNEPKPFSPALCPVIEGVHNPHVKSCLHLPLRVLYRNPHSAIPLNWLRPSWVACGAQTGRLARALTVETPQSAGPAFILHRMYRSRIEYVSDLARGIPTGGAELFKVNRRGYLDKPKDAEVVPITLPDAQIAALAQSQKRFEKSAGLRSLIAEQRRATVARASEALRRYVSMPQDEQARWAQQLRGVKPVQLAQKLGVAAPAHEGPNPPAG